MAQVTYRANLGVKKFPLLSTDQGRSVIVKGQDQNYIAPVASTEDKTFDIGIPQIYYAENVMPTSQGYQSVGFKIFVSADGSVAEISEVYILRNDLGERAQLGVDGTTGKFYVLKQGSSTWLLVDTIAAAIGKLVSVAHVSGVSYIYVANDGCYVFDFTTDTLTPTTLTGLVASEVIFLLAISGYLHAYSTDTAAWSSVIDPTDFTPSLATGAGGGSVEGAEGKIVHGIPVSGGAIIFTDSNAVACTFSDNSRFPFRFTPIAGAGGLVGAKYCVDMASSSVAYAYTTSGLQAFSLRQAKTINPDVTDFLSGEVIETFNSATNEFTQKPVIGVMAKRIAFIADRYLVLSYGEGELTHAIVIDTLLDQYGKLAVPHISCFEFTLYDQTQWDTPKKSIAFVGINGKVSLVDFSFTSIHSGILLLGKYQYVRSRLLQLNTVEVETVGQAATFTCHSIPSLDGEESSSAVAGFPLKVGKRGRKFGFNVTALNHSILAKGTFDFNTLLLTFTIHGGR